MSWFMLYTYISLQVFSFSRNFFNFIPFLQTFTNLFSIFTLSRGFSLYILRNLESFSNRQKNSIPFLDFNDHPLYW